MLRGMQHSEWIVQTDSPMCLLSPDPDQPVGGRFAGAGIALGEVGEEEGAGAAEAGAEEGGEGAGSQTTTQGAAGQEGGRPVCCL